MDPLLKKLQYRQGVVVVLQPPPELDDVLQAWQDHQVPVSYELLPDSGFVCVFVRSNAEVDRQSTIVVPSLADDAVLWFAYPKKSSPKYDSDVSRDGSWRALADAGFQAVRQVAVDDDWSALRFSQVRAAGKERA